MIDVPDLSLGDVFDDGLSAIVAAVVFVLILFFVLVPVAALLVEVLLVVIFVAGYVAGRVVLRRPWDIEATAGGRTHRVRAKGWRASRAAMRELAEAIQRGEPPARPLSAPVPSAGSEPR
jgi:phage-related minor tail protein